jgi:hypothetical protein
MKRDLIKPKSHGKKLKYPRGQKSFYREEGDFGPTRVSIKKAHIKDYGPDCDIKLGPLVRFLNKHKGKNWDEVYSEICKQADSRTWEGERFRESLDWVVVKNCFIEGDQVFDEHGFELGRWRSQFYIHPKTNTLEEVISKRKRGHRNTLSQPQSVFKMSNIYYHKHGGTWYRVKMIEVTQATIRRISDPVAQTFYRHPAYYSDVFLSSSFANSIWGTDYQIK